MKSGTPTSGYSGRQQPTTAWTWPIAGSHPALGYLANCCEVSNPRWTQVLVAVETTKGICQLGMGPGLLTYRQVSLPGGSGQCSPSL